MGEAPSYATLVLQKFDVHLVMFGGVTSVDKRPKLIMPYM